MKSVSRIALRAALMLGCATILSATPALAKDDKGSVSVTSSSGRTFNLSKEERTAMAPLADAMQKNDWAAAAAALPAAQAAATSADAKYLIAAQQLKIGASTNNAALELAGINGMIASGLVDQAQLPDLLRNQAALQEQAGDRKAATASLTKLVEANPNDVDSIMTLARLHSEQKDYAGAVPLIDRAVTIRETAGQQVPENWYKYGLNYAMVSRNTPEAMKFAERLVKAYPSSKNWRDVLLSYRDLQHPEKSTELDLLRLMRFSKALAGERDVTLLLADSLSRAGLPGETKAVLDEGVANGMVEKTNADYLRLSKAAAANVAEDRRSLPGQESKALAAPTGAPALSTGDAYFGYGDYAKAATLYRAALQKGSVDANLVNTHLGLALALAGQKAEAEQALKAVTGPRAELANFMLIWLSQRA